MDTLDALIKHKADIHVPDAVSKYQPIHYAANLCNDDSICECLGRRVVTGLLESKANVNAVGADERMPCHVPLLLAWMLANGSLRNKKAKSDVASV